MSGGRLIWTALAALAAWVSVPDPLSAADSRLRSVPYSGDEVYRLHGIAGYQIDLEFDVDERFVGIGSGDVEGLAFEAQDNHLFIKPRAINVRTNLTVLTTKHTYHFDYSSGPVRLDSETRDLIYALRFVYPKPAIRALTHSAADEPFAQAAPRREHNADYWYCGRDSLQPIQAWDDGVHTHLRFNPRIELPALFVRNDDGTESLLNFNVEHDELIIHRIARQFIVRRGALVGCILNRGFAGSGEALDTGTVSPDVERTIRMPAGTP
jgi:type IV secretion system protein VirB9